MTDIDSGNLRPTLRASGLKDLGEIQSLYRKMTVESGDPLSSLQPNDALVDWKLKRLRQDLLAEERYICAVAESEQVIIGYAAGVVVTRGSVFAVETTGLLAEVYVEASWRRQGIARQLTQMVLDAFAGRGIHWVEATVPEGVSSAEELAGRLGFRKNTRSFLVNLTETNDE